MAKKPPRKAPLLGAHFSIAKGLHNALNEAISYGCNALQIFTKNASTWKERILSETDVARFHQMVEETGIDKIASHTSYLINLAAIEKKKHAMSCCALKHELIRSSQLSIPFVVLHPGAHMGKGEKKGIRKIATSINQIFKDAPDAQTRLLLETTAGQGSSIGHTFEQLASVMEKIIQHDRIGVCLDTCHIFAAGYDIRTGASYQKTIKQFDAVIGLEHLYWIHLNDSKRALGSRVDRHEHIGQGSIGLKAFGAFMNDKRFRDIPKIIETKKEKNGDDWDRVNLNRLMRLIGKEYT